MMGGGALALSRCYSRRPRFLHPFRMLHQSGSILHVKKQTDKVNSMHYSETCEREALWSTLKKQDCMHSIINGCA
jgi:hypothetical protein